MSDNRFDLLNRVETGTGLPMHLLYLRLRHPREGWAGATSLAGTGEVWLANHSHFRALTDRIAGGVDALRAGRSAQAHFDRIFRHDLGSLLAGLDGHHRVEDHSYFPRFQKAVPKLAQGFEMLEADHAVIHEAIHDLSFAGQGLVRELDPTAEAVGEALSDAARFVADDLAATLARFGKVLARHLDDEEDLVIPYLLERARKDPDFGADRP